MNIDKNRLLKLAEIENAANIAVGGLMYHTNSNKIVVAYVSNGRATNLTGYLWPVLLSPTNRLTGLEVASNSLLAVFEEPLRWPSIGSKDKFRYKWYDLTSFDSEFNLIPGSRLPINATFNDMEWTLVEYPDGSVNSRSRVLASNSQDQINFLLADLGAITGIRAMISEDQVIDLISCDHRIKDIKEQLKELGYDC